MDPEYARRDARAVEDPIAAVFDLAESVDRQTPKIRRVLRYVRWFVSLWLLLDFVLILIVSEAPGLTLLVFVPLVGFLVALRYARSGAAHGVVLAFVVAFAVLQTLTGARDLPINAVLVTLFVLGFVILDLMRDLRSFFGYFALRHRVILAVRQADPVVHVPQGKDAAARILTHLSSTDGQARAAMAVPGAVASPALLTGRSGLTYSFDAVLRWQPTRLSRILGGGPAPFAVYAKAFDRAPTVDDLRALQKAVEDVSVAIRIPPARVFAVWQARGDAAVGADAYEFLTRETVRVTIRGTTYACSLQLAREGDDGTYDFIPVVMEPVSPGARTAAA